MDFKLLNASISEFGLYVKYSKDFLVIKSFKNNSYAL